VNEILHGLSFVFLLVLVVFAIISAAAARPEDIGAWVAKVEQGYTAAKEAAQ